MDTTHTSNFSLPSEFKKRFVSELGAADGFVCFYNGVLLANESRFDDRIQLLPDGRVEVISTGEEPFILAIARIYGNQLGEGTQKPSTVACRHHYKIYSRAEVVETHIAVNDLKIEIENATRLELVDGANVNYGQTFWVGNEAVVKNEMTVHLAANARLNSLALNVGCLRLQNKIEVELTGNGADCQFQGLSLATRQQQIETVSRIRHLVADTKSSQLMKSVVNEQARVAFLGQVEIAKDAQKSDAHQLSQSLLLSREAVVVSEPQLDVGADDVSATHGATVGQIDEQQLFYLVSRGVSRAEARHALAIAYQRDVIERLDRGFVRTHIENLHAQMPVEFSAERAESEMTEDIRGSAQ